VRWHPNVKDFLDFSAPIQTDERLLTFASHLEKKGEDYLILKGFHEVNDMKLEDLIFHDRIKIIGNKLYAVEMKVASNLNITSCWNFTLFLQLKKDKKMLFNYGIYDQSKKCGFFFPETNELKFLSLKLFELNK
jgi:hypothetical protein